MKKIIPLVALMFIGVFFSVQRRHGETLGTIWKEREFENGEAFEEEDERYDQPFKFQEYLNALKIRDGQTKSEYAPSYQFLEHKAAWSKASMRKLATATRVQSGNGVLEWKERGPGNVPGRTRALLVDPDDANHLTWYAGSASGGIWKTTDGGTSWVWLSSTLPNLATTSLAMADANHNIMYAGTGEGYGNLDGVSGHGVFKSTDRGQTWTLLVSSIDFGDINRLVINPGDPNNVVVASNLGIYFTIDGGTSWTKSYTGIVQDIDATPGNFNILYGGEYRNGIVKSIDGGQNWQYSNAGMNPNGRVELAVSPLKPSRIFVSAEGTLSVNHSDLYLSDDSGATWTLVNVSLSGKTVDFLSAVGGTLTQGSYDNTIACSPYDQNVVYVGGIGVFQVAVTSGSTTVDNWVVNESSTQSFLLLQQFSNVIYASGKLDVGGTHPHSNVEVRFGPGMTQKAHRFTVPPGSTSGVADNSYTYQDYVDVNFQVWDVTAGRQLMVSFRDQNGNGQFDLLPQNFDTADPTHNSREYVYIHGTTYNPSTPDPTIAVTGGHKTNMWYNIFPALTAPLTTWDPKTAGILVISYAGIAKQNAITLSVSDPYSDYDGKNNSTVIHPDHHFLLPIPVDDVLKTFRLLDANDGGVYVSGVSTAPGTTQGSWTAVGKGYNTGQFYGVDKRPGADQYIGGLQDNGTQLSPAGTSASSMSAYNSVIGGDGFEVIWNNGDAQKMIGGYYGDHFLKSTDGGASWTVATSGLSTDATEFPFISRLANSRNNPDVIFTPGKSGVWKSTNFGSTWKLTAISGKWGMTNFIDAEVSAANANIVWAGAGMNASTSVFVSTDAGATFQATQNYAGATLGVLSRLATHPTDPKTAYALFSFAHSPKILRTTDLGQTWTDISGFGSGTSSSNGFPDVAVYSLYVRPDNPSIIWAGTEIGIVESLDSGSTWALLTDFPSVALWDLKGVDDQIVIGTHGRGIWTARVAQQQMALQNPVIAAYGTSPQSKFVVKLHFPQVYDSTQVLISNNKIGTISTNTIGDYAVEIGNVNPGSVSLEVVSYLNGGPAHTKVVAQQLDLLGYQTKYYNYFTNANDFVSNGFSLNSLSGASHKTLQTAHSYASGTELTSVLRVPIVIGSALPNFFFTDIAMVQHGAAGTVFGDPAFKDYVVVEGTLDGITWIPLANGYNSSSTPSWLSAYNSSQAPTAALEVNHNFSLTPTFAAGDTALFRFRLFSDTDGVTGWGWSIDEVTIQQQPTGLDPGVQTIQVDVFPNPARGKFSVRYTLPDPSSVSIQILDIAGRTAASYSLGTQSAGENTHEIDKDLSPGTYLVQVKTNRGQLVRKVVIL